MQSHAGCEKLKAVEVQLSDRRADTNWALYAFTEATADPETVQRALAATQEKLRHRYDLRAPQ
ncbi:hypothetical protein SAMN05216374_0445 [Tardiphaga sp. OK246]|nr:hypothetical protein SAMN05216374_0445 [Tardiphaga sp. OK246]